MVRRNLLPAWYSTPRRHNQTSKTKGLVFASPFVFVLNWVKIVAHFCQKKRALPTFCPLLKIFWDGYFVKKRVFAHFLWPFAHPLPTFVHKTGLEKFVKNRVKIVKNSLKQGKNSLFRGIFGYFWLVKKFSAHFPTFFFN